MIYKVLFSFLIVLIFFRGASSQGVQTDSVMNTDKLLSLPFEDLMQVKVITPTRTLQQAIKAPATVTVITADQIRLRGYRNLAEVLNDLPDFIVKDKSDPQFYNAITSRGVYRQDHLLILLDGVRISSPTNEPLPILENFPIYIAKQIEVVYGPGSALYGADAMSGVINIITQKVDGDQHSTLTAVGGSQGYTSANIIFNKRLKNNFNLSVAGQYTYDEQPDFSKIYENEYDMTSHETGIFNTSYGSITTQQPVIADYEAPVKSFNIYSSIDKEGFTMKFLHHYVQVPSSTTLKPDNGVYNKNVFYGQGVTVGSASYTTSIGKWQAISTLTGSFYKVNPGSNYRNLYGNIEQGFKYSTGSMMKAEQQVNYNVSKKISLTGGVTYELFQSVPKTPELEYPVDAKNALNGVLLNSTSSGNPNGIEVQFFSLIYSNIASYFQGQYAPIDKLSIVAGVRYDKNSRFGSTINPRMGAVFNPFEKTTIKILYGTAFWAPSPHVSFESYGSFSSVDSGQTYQSGFWHLPNPDLKPMTSETAEISIKQNISNKLKVTLTAYSSTIKNMINSVQDNGNTNLYNNKFLGWDVDFIEVPVNNGTQKNYGGNLAINGTFGLGKLKLDPWASVSYVEGKVHDLETTKETEQQSIIPWQIRMGLDMRLKEAFYGSIRLLKAFDQRTATFTDPTSPYERKTVNGYVLLNASVGYSFKNRMSFFVNVQNALNQHYRNTIAWDASGPNAETYESSFQNPLRIMTGISVEF